MARAKTVAPKPDAGRFPIGFWNYTPIADQDASAVRDWADAGMTLTIGPFYGAGAPDARRMRAILDAAAAADIRVILSHNDLFADRIEPDEAAYRRALERAVRDLKGHPAAFGFHLGDEPDTAAFPRYCRAMRVHREAAPQLTPFINLLPMFPGIETRIGYSDWGRYLDDYVAGARPPFLCYDCYAQMNPDAEADGFWGFEMYFANLRTYWEAAARHGLDYWTTLLSVGHFRYRCPREDDLRWQLNTAVAHGAKGLLWFFFYMRAPQDNYRVSPIDEHGERTETYGWLSRVNRTFLKWHAPVLLQCRLSRVSHVGKAWGGWPSFDGLGRFAEARSSTGTSLILSEFRHASGAEYLAVVNNSQTASTHAELAVRGRQPVLRRVGWQGVETGLVDSTGVGATAGVDRLAFGAWLAPGQMELYRLEER